MEALKALSPEERLPALVFADKTDQQKVEQKNYLLSLNGKQRLTAQIERQITSYLPNQFRVTKEYLRTVFEAWVDREQFGNDLVLALEAYINNFFGEEEVRIKPAQEQALKDVQNLFREHDLLTSAGDPFNRGAYGIRQ